MQFYAFVQNKEDFVPRLKRVIWWLQHPVGREPDYGLLIGTLELFACESFCNLGVWFEVSTKALFRETPLGKQLCKW